MLVITGRTSSTTTRTTSSSWHKPVLFPSPMLTSRGSRSNDAGVFMCVCLSKSVFEGMCVYELRRAPSTC